jgi:methionyl-tRNA formyltransferase
MKIAILCTDPGHPVNPWLQAWAGQRAGRDEVVIAREARALEGGDFLFLVSCHQIIRADVRDRFRYVLVLHASALPHGRGMSPHIWQILGGADRLTVTLLEAVDGLDEGPIWHQRELRFDGTELHDEIHRKLFDAEVALMDWAIDHCDSAQPRVQHGEPSHFRKRTPADSAIDPQRPLAESFDLLRVADPDRYPAFFEFRGRRYRLRIDRLDV